MNPGGKGTSMLEAKKLGMLAAVGLFLITVVAAILLAKFYLFSPDSQQAPSESAGTGSAAAPASQIQVGIMLSQFTATGPHRDVLLHGYDGQTRPISELHDPQIHLIPVIEPGTRRARQLSQILSRYFPGERPLDGTREEDLKNLDVLVATSVANCPDEVIMAVTQRVREGMGFLERQFGYETPGYNAQTRALCGFSDGVFALNSKPVLCEIVGTHPLLGDLSGRIGSVITLVPNGTAGTLLGIPLIRVKNMKQVSVVNSDHTVSTGEYLYPFYVSQLGRGRIVGIGYSVGQAMPPELNEANHGRFYIHCVQWLSENAVN
jgi:hypothetical protein